MEHFSLFWDDIHTPFALKFTRFWFIFLHQTNIALGFLSASGTRQMGAIMVDDSSSQSAVFGLPLSGYNMSLRILKELVMPSLNKTTYCPECQGKITLKKTPRLGQTVVCNSCQTRLEVIETTPLELDWSFDDDDEGDDFSDFESDYDAYDEDLDSRIYSNY